MKAYYRPFIVTLIAALHCSLLYTLNLEKLAPLHVVITNETDHATDLLCNYSDQKQQSGTAIAPILHLGQSASHTLATTPRTDLPSDIQIDCATLVHATHLSCIRKSPSILAVTLKPLPQHTSPYTKQCRFIPAMVPFRDGLRVDTGRWNDIIAGRWNYAKACAPKKPQELLSFLETLYARNKDAVYTATEIPKIPKVIHHIWLGSKLPDRFHSWYETWLVQHPTWKHILWTDNTAIQHNPNFHKKYGDIYEERNIHELGKLKNQALYDEAKNYGERSDIIRFEILDRFGGLYTDIDYECFEPFDILHHSYDFYACMLPLDTGLLSVNNGILAAAAGHPVLRATMQRMESSKRINRHHYFSIICATGPIPFTRGIWEAAGNTGYTDIVLPCTFFHPLSYRKTKLEKTVDIAPESMAIHYFTKTWARASAHAK